MLLVSKYTLYVMTVDNIIADNDTMKNLKDRCVVISFLKLNLLCPMILMDNAVKYAIIFATIMCRSNAFV